MLEIRLGPGVNVGEAHKLKFEVMLCDPVPAICLLHPPFLLELLF